MPWRPAPPPPRRPSPGWTGAHHHTLSGILWGDGVLVTSEQSLPDAASYTAILPGGARVAATLAGRDPATNVAALRLASVAPGAASRRRRAGSAAWCWPSAATAPAMRPRGWGRSRSAARPGSRSAGGRIDALVRIGVRLGPAAEGGPVIDARGRLAGHVHLRPAPHRAGHPRRHHRPRHGGAAGAGARRPRLARRRAASGGAAEGTGRAGGVDRAG